MFLHNCMLHNIYGKLSIESKLVVSLKIILKNCSHINNQNVGEKLPGVFSFHFIFLCVHILAKVTLNTWVIVINLVR